MRSLVRLTLLVLIVGSGMLFALLAASAPASGTQLSAMDATQHAALDISPSRPITTQPPSVTPSSTGNLPDLTIVGMSISLANSNCFRSGDPLGTFVFVKNIGAVDVGAFVVALDDKVQSVSSLATGQNASVWFPFYIQNNNSVAIVDFGNQITESNELNNSLALFLPVPTPPIACTPTPLLTVVSRAYFPWINRAPATPTLTPTPLPTPVLGAVIFQGTVQVSNIKYQGVEANEADEYVEIKNVGTQPVNLDGWNLKAIHADGTIIDQYIFGNGFTLAVGQTCHIYTAKLSLTDNCGTGTGFDSSVPIWPNSTGARASLFNQANVEQARFTY